MYEYPPDRNWLYIGDMIVGLELPNLKAEHFRLVPQNDPDAKPYLVRSMMSNDFFVYLSHECDCSDDKRQYFIITPMISIDMGIRRNSEAFNRLIESNDVSSHPHYLNHFYFSNFQSIFQEDKIIDFTRVISVPTGHKDFLLKRKILQLDVKTRTLLKTKIAYYFAHERNGK